MPAHPESSQLNTSTNTEKDVPDPDARTTGVFMAACYQSGRLGLACYDSSVAEVLARLQRAAVLWITSSSHMHLRCLASIILFIQDLIADYLSHVDCMQVLVMQTQEESRGPFAYQSLQLAKLQFDPEVRSSSAQNLLFPALTCRIFSTRLSLSDAGDLYQC